MRLLGAILLVWGWGCHSMPPCPLKEESAWQATYDTSIGVITRTAEEIIWQPRCLSMTGPAANPVHCKRRFELVCRMRGLKVDTILLDPKQPQAAFEAHLTTMVNEWRKREDAPPPAQAET